MILSRRALYLLGGLGFLLGLGATVAIASSDHLQDDNALMMATSPLVGWSFIGTGLFAWTRRPDNRTGRLMTAVGFTWLIGTGWATESPLLATIGWLFASIPFVLLLHMLVAFPTGRLRGRFERGLVGMGYFATTVVQVAWLLFSDTSEVDCDGCPRNLLLLRDDDDLAGIIFTAQSVIGLLALGAAVVVFALRYRFTPAEHRAALTPVFLAGVVLIVLVQFSLIANVTGGVDVLEAVADLGGQFALIAIPFAFLVGLLRTRLTRAASVSALIERLGHGSNLRDALADALADPTLALAFRAEGRFVDAAGRPVADDGSRTWTEIEREGQVVGAIVHDPVVAQEDPGALRAAAAAAGLAIENDLLQAQLRVRIEELRESRARLVEATDAERRRLERDLHDGAQQRLVALALNLRLARERSGEDAAALLDESLAELAQATEELRELARGIHPAVLTDRGLAPALRALASRAPLPVEITRAPEERLPGPVESAAYFVVAEALTNVQRYAQAQHAEVEVARENGHVVVEVRDDGVGGADPAAGSGLRGLADRLAALDGRLTVESAPGAGTVVRGEIPCGS